MSMTPWGESEGLRERKLPPGPGVTPEDVELNHRERLYGATVAVVAEKGYPETTIADLTQIAGVSRSTFYKYFRDKHACFIATLEILVDGVAAVTASKLHSAESTEERARNGMAAFIGLLTAQPDAARLCVVHSESAGPEAIAIVDRSVETFEEMVLSVFAEMPDQRAMPREMVAAMVGAVRKIMQTRLHRRTESELAEMVPSLVELALTYRPPPAPLPVRVRRKLPPSTPVIGIDEPAEKIERATIEVIARSSFASATMADIAEEAGVSFQTFYGLFDDKAAALDAALLRSRLRMAAATMPSFQRSKSWPEGIWALIHTGLAYLESEPAFAQLITVDIHSAGERALEGRDRAIESSRFLIEIGMHEAEMENSAAAEAIQSGLYWMLAMRMRSRKRNNLRGMAPLMIYMTLVPFLGVATAYEWALRR